MPRVAGPGNGDPYGVNIRWLRVGASVEEQVPGQIVSLYGNDSHGFADIP